MVPGERSFFAFKNYGYARITKAGSVSLRGDRTGVSLPGANGSVVLNGKEARAIIKEGVLLFGKPPTMLEDRSDEPLREVPMIVKTNPAVVRALGRRLATAGSWLSH